ncbi:DUF1365 domain-containing protein [Reinekea marinisedimentorum]|uniref:DUF1365 family protein n=1 Tax=Reinekea marinisedimentorum TaxID=230495 RepID=A0A4V2UIR4_9GAMM|nr:DUF1365 domain-containing protein [Reinekea marinisedimentorum]TCS37110.1 hypothetical protein BCF53_12128 [Reinekea marinisedimentorum]
MATTAALKSVIYSGKVNHRRFEQKHHSFTYPLYMLALDVDELEQNKLDGLRLFGTGRFKPIRFKQSDYIKGDRPTLRERITDKLKELGLREAPASYRLLVQCRCFGLYFSPANFVFCYSETGECSHMLVEVSNTPWNQRHYYLVDMARPEPTEKSFHVSPFMDLDMKYFWQVKPPLDDSEAVSVRIENKRTDGAVAFDATLAMKKLALNNQNLKSVWHQQPMMTLSVLKGIYVQALRLFIKKIKFVPYQTKTESPTIK